MKVDRWSQQMLYWQLQGGHHKQGHTCKRWCDDLDEFFQVRFDLDHREEELAYIGGQTGQL
eukprot:9185099-Karenia_brevis.AAC.1